MGQSPLGGSRRAPRGAPFSHGPTLKGLMRPTSSKRTPDLREFTFSSLFYRRDSEACADVGVTGAQHADVGRVLQSKRLGTVAYLLLYARGGERAVDLVDEGCLTGDERCRHGGPAPVCVHADREGAADVVARRGHVHPESVVGEVGLLGVPVD